MQPSREQPQHERGEDERRRLQIFRINGPAAAAVASSSQHQPHERIPLLDSLRFQSAISPYHNLGSSFLSFCLDQKQQERQQQHQRQQQQQQQQQEDQQQRVLQLQRQLQLQHQLGNVGISSPAAAVRNHAPEFIPTQKPEPKPQHGAAAAAAATSVSHSDATGDRIATEKERNRRLINNPMPYDVLFGRGRPLQAHPGNLRFHRIVNKYRKVYKNARKDGKSTVTATVLAEISTPDSDVVQNQRQDEKEKTAVKDVDEQKQGDDDGRPIQDDEEGLIKDPKTDASTRTTDRAQYKTLDEPSTSQDSKKQDANHVTCTLSVERKPHTAKLQGGRFLRRTESGNNWMEVTTTEAMEKTSHALRGYPRRSELGRSAGSGGGTAAAAASGGGGGHSITASSSTTSPSLSCAGIRSSQNMPDREAMATSPIPLLLRENRKRKRYLQTKFQQGLRSNKKKAPAEINIGGNSSLCLPFDASTPTVAATDAGLGLSAPTPTPLSGISFVQPLQEAFLAALQRQRQQIETFLAAQQQQKEEKERHSLIEGARQELKRQVLIESLAQFLQQEQSQLQSRRQRDQQRLLQLQQEQELIQQLLQQRQQQQNHPSSISQGLQLFPQQQQLHQQQQQPHLLSQRLSQLLPPHVNSDITSASMLRGSPQDTSVSLLVRNQHLQTLRLRELLYSGGLAHAQIGDAKAQDDKQEGE